MKIEGQKTWGEQKEECEVKKAEKGKTTPNDKKRREGKGLEKRIQNTKFKGVEGTWRREILEYSDRG